MTHSGRRLRLFILSCLAILPGTFSGSVPSECRAETEDGDIVAVENSPQFAKDCAGIDHLRCEASGDTPIDSFKTMIDPKDAKSAHSLLRRFLAEYPLRHPPSGYRIVEDHALRFFRGSKGRDLAFSICFYLGLVEIVYYPRNAPDHKPIATVFRLDKRGEAEYYSVMADCLAQSNPECAREFRRKAAAIWVPRLLGFGLVLLVLGLVVFVAVRSLWRPKTIVDDVGEVGPDSQRLPEDAPLPPDGAPGA